MLLSFIKAEYRAGQSVSDNHPKKPNGGGSVDSAAPGLEFLNTRGFSDTETVRKGGRAGYLLKHTSAPASCFPSPGERSDKQSDSGLVCGLWGMQKQDAAACSPDWRGGTMSNAFPVNSQFAYHSFLAVGFVISRTISFKNLQNLEYLTPFEPIHQKQEIYICSRTNNFYSIKTPGFQRLLGKKEPFPLECNRASNLK